jgi:hypothetical protein
MKFVSRALLAALCLTLSSAVAGAAVYRGFPHLHLTMAVVDAGGGSGDFDARRLVDRLAGPGAAAENAKIVRQYGRVRIASFYAVFTFAVDDALKKAHNMMIPLPRSAQPNPADGPALSSALYHAGMTQAGRYDVGYMLEMLMSHQIHHDIMGDMDRKFSPPVNADFHIILTSVMHDVGRQYGLVAKS